jgi:hypothetical protein
MISSHFALICKVRVSKSWFSPGTPASSTTKTGCHDIAKLLLKVALKHQKIKSNQIMVQRSKPYN